MATVHSPIRVRVTQIRLEATGIAAFELRPVSGEQELPSFTAGAHIDVHMPGGMVRSYSLLNDQSERTRYVIAVQLEPHGRGGSTWMHTGIHIGMELNIGHPVNDFPLHEAASESIFIAGGIGITPILSMIQRLERLGRPWHLYYGARQQENAAFVQELSNIDKRGRVRLFFGSTQNEQPDIRAIVADASPQAHLYCCGPRGMLDSFLLESSGRAAATVHFERFGAAQEASTAGGFEMVLARSGKSIRVEAGNSMLEVLIEHNVPVQYACSAGVCGSCKTTVLEGVPDHRDDYLTDEERRSNQFVMVCCSGSKTDRLYLDL